MLKKCLNCKKEFRHRPKVQFCSYKCYTEYSKQKRIDNWLKGNDIGYYIGKTIQLKDFIRKYLLKKSNYKCSKCGWNEINPITKKSPLEINHIDGNAKNCHIKNLEVLCPNCHSLTYNYKALNKKSARTR